jgi:hypothetical protein
MAKIKICNRYGVIPNILLNDTNLSLKCKGLYAFIQSKPDDWEFSEERLSMQLKESLGCIRSVLLELEKGGYLVRNYFYNSKGFRNVEYILKAEPT